MSAGRPALDGAFLLGPRPGWVGGSETASARLALRPIVEEERAGARAYRQGHHYLDDNPLVGKLLRHGAWLDGEVCPPLCWLR